MFFNWFRKLLRIRIGGFLFCLPYSFYVNLYKKGMSTIEQIQKEAETLPNNLQQKVLLYIETLKYQAALGQTESLVKQAEGIQISEHENVEDMTALAGESSMNEWSLAEIQEKTILIEQINAALIRSRLAEKGPSTVELREKALKWRTQ